MSDARRDRRREVIIIYGPGKEEFSSDGYTSDQAVLEAGETIAWREAHRHRDKLQGKPYGGIEPALQVLARGLSKWPPTKAWFPWVMAVFWLMRHEPPKDGDMPRVNDYRTTAARRIRERKAAQGTGPWSYPRAQALAERFNWPST